MLMLLLVSGCGIGRRVGVIIIVVVGIIIIITIVIVGLIDVVINRMVLDFVRVSGRARA